MTERDRSEAPAKRRLPRWGRALVWLVAVLAVVTAGLWGASRAVSNRPLAAPGWMTAQAEARINAMLGNHGRISLGQIVLLIDAQNVPRITLRDVGFYDAGGAIVARFNDVGASLSMDALRARKLQPEVLRLSGAQAVVRRLADGTFDLSMPGGGDGTPTTITSALERIDQAFAPSGPLAGITRVSASDLTLTLEDARSQRIWQVTGGTLDLRQAAGLLEVALDFDIFNGTEELASTEFRFTKRRGSPEAELTARFDNAAAADIALQLPVLAFLGVLNAPISGDVSARINREGVLGSLSGSLALGAGALQPTAGAEPFDFDNGAVHFAYDPSRERLTFPEVAVTSDAMALRATGHAYLRDFADGWPTAFVGQFALADVRLAPGDLFDAPVQVDRGAVDFRLRLDPFTVDIGQLMLRANGARLLGDGQIAARADGWSISADAVMDETDMAQVLALWPAAVAPRTRTWLADNVNNARIGDLRAALRLRPGQPLRNAISWRFDGADLRYVKTMPMLSGAHGYGSIEGRGLVLVLDGGQVVAPAGGRVDAAGSVMRIADITARPSRIALELQTDSTITDALSLLDLPPLQVLRGTDFGPDLASGRAQMRADIDFTPQLGAPPVDLDYAVTGTLVDVESAALAPPRVLRAERLALTATPAAIEVSGLAQLGGARFDSTWRQPLGPDARGAGSVVEGVAVLDQALLDEFAVGLPAGAVRGAGRAPFQLTLGGEAGPTFRLESDLAGVALDIAQIGWRKAANTTGKLEVAGSIGPRPAIDTLNLSAPGLSATGGQISLRDGGGLQSARFDRVRLGGWLNAPLRLEGRGRGAAPAIHVTGGEIDLRRARFDQLGGGGGNGGPIALALDRLVVSEGIVLHGVNGAFSTQGGFQGDFTANVAGTTPIAGQLSPSENGTAIWITAQNGGEVLRDAGVFASARGGALDLMLLPLAASGTYDGRMRLRDTRIVDAPAVTEILSLMSIVGLLEQLSGPGIRFSDIEAEFRLDPARLTLLRSSATGPSLGVSLDGVYDLGARGLDLQGVISPVYFLNGIGQVFTRRGEGLFGFNFRLSGPAATPKVEVNPLSILTPGMFREIFRRPPPQVPTEVPAE